MKQGKMIEAYKTLESIKGNKLSTVTAMRLFKLKKALLPAYEFQLERERLIFDKFAPELDNGILKFKSKEDKQDFEAALTELSNAETGTEVEPVHISVDEVSLQLSMEDIEHLDGFVIFEDGEPEIKMEAISKEGDE